MATSYVAGKEELQIRQQDIILSTNRIERSTPCPDLPMQLYHKRKDLESEL